MMNFMHVCRTHSALLSFPLVVHNDLICKDRMCLQAALRDLFDGAARSDPTDVQVAKVLKLLVFPLFPPLILPASFFPCCWMLVNVFSDFTHASLLSNHHQEVCFLFFFTFFSQKKKKKLVFKVN